MISTRSIRAPRPAHVIRTGGISAPVLAKGTRDIQPPQLPLDTLGMNWWWSLTMEQLGRNIATAGALEYAFRLGLSHDAVRRAGRR